MTTTSFGALTALVFTALTSCTLLAQDTPAESPEWKIRFENLAPTEQQQFGEHFMEATRLFGQKRIFEALNSVTEAEKIYKDYPSCLNLKGACYVEFRDFDAARKCFEMASKLSPENADITFNLAEIAFVTQNWERCETLLNEALSLTPETKIQMIRLIEFKLLLAKQKLGKAEEVKQLAAKYDFDDDSPFHYYSQAALAYEKGDTEKAEEWLRICRRVFVKDELIAPWQDTMIEYGYIRSFYGGDLEVPNAPEAP